MPRCTPEQCIDIMVEVMSNIGLHLAAADGYLKTGMTVALDGTQDSFIVREAGHFWKEFGMREKINAAVAEVPQSMAFAVSGPDNRSRGLVGCDVDRRPGSGSYDTSLCAWQGPPPDMI